MKSKCRPRKCRISHVNSLRKELNRQGKILEMKVIKVAFDRKECKKFEMALGHKFNFYVHKELKCGVGLRSI